MAMKIYALIDPQSKQIRYIGATTRTLKTRLGDHIRKSRQGEKTHRAAWIRKLLGLSLRPSITLIEETEDWHREVFWIKHFRDQAIGLTNGTEGGEGWGIKSPEARRRIAAASSARVWTAESRARASASRCGYQMPQSTKDKLRLINLGRKRGPHSDETIQKMRQSKLGHSVSEITREKISKALTGRPTGRKPTHCPKGHSYSGANLIINCRGARECRICRQASFRAAYARRKIHASSGAVAMKAWPQFTQEVPNSVS